ncbi:MAG: PTS system mannose/fructose/sorbose family transporter subunit IID [Gemmatimonadota bacterium]|nr:PTS system mannose/fructose/sorbose family transporter subunit IID [Gemmatimonadota bacterium]
MSGAAPIPLLPLRTRAAILLRLLAVQGSWNYELLVGPGIGFCSEPGLRRLPGGQAGEAYRAALARQARYFNAHPYLASLAVGALVRAETDGEPPAQIERFRTALCGPLGSVGDRLVWAGWLPFCSLLALSAFGMGASPAVVLILFFGVYNAGHLTLRVWGINVGWRHGLRVAQALGSPVLRQGPSHIARAAALLAGLALPLVLRRVVGPDSMPILATAAAVVVIAGLLIRLHGRVEGWRVALVALAALTLYSVAR